MRKFNKKTAPVVREFRTALDCLVQETESEIVLSCPTAYVPDTRGPDLGWLARDVFSTEFAVTL